MTADLNATQLGERGPRLVLLHGLFGQGKNFTSVARELAAGARVTLLDLPDHGRSPWSASFSYPEMAARVAAHLEDEGGGEPYAVVGHSMGGKVAMTLALLHRTLVDRLGVVDVSPVVTAAMSSFGTYVDGMRAVEVTTLKNRASADAALQPYAPDPVVRSFLLQNLRREPTGWRWQMNLRLLGDELPLVAGWPDLTVPPYRAEPYTGPVLWLAGGRSDYIRPEHAPAMRALFPRVQTVTVKDAGHWVHAEQPAVFTGVLRRFLGL